MIFTVEVTLTVNGLANWMEVAATVLQYLEMLRRHLEFSLGKVFLILTANVESTPWEEKLFTSTQLSSQLRYPEGGLPSYLYDEQRQMAECTFRFQQEKAELSSTLIGEGC